MPKVRISEARSLSSISFENSAHNPSIFRANGLSPFSLYQCRMLRAPNFDSHIEWSEAVLSPIDLERVNWFPLACQLEIRTVLLDLREYPRNRSSTIAVLQLSTRLIRPHCNPSILVGLRQLAATPSHICILHVPGPKLQCPFRT